MAARVAFVGAGPGDPGLMTVRCRELLAAADIASKELAFTVCGLGTYSREFAREVREKAASLGVEALITDDYLDVEQRVQGHIDRPLNAKGMAQADALARRFLRGQAAALYCSDLLRARQTAAAIAGSLGGQRVHVSALLNEVRVPLEGRPLQEGIDANWDTYTGNQPPFETAAVVLARVLRFVLLCLRRHPGQTVVAVTHGDPIAFLMLWAWAQPIAPEPKALMYVDYVAVASIATFEFSGEPTGLPVVRYTRCLLYTSDAADDLLCVDLGGRRIIKKKKQITTN